MFENVESEQKALKEPHHHVLKRSPQYQVVAVLCQASTCGCTAVNLHSLGSSLISFLDKT